LKFVLLFFFTLVLGSSIGQIEGPLSFSITPKVGSLMAHRNTMSHLIKGRDNSVEFSVSKQDFSDDKWSNTYHFPSRGFAVIFNDFGNPEVLGQGLAFFRYTKFPILQDSLFGFIDFRLGNGISFLTRKYDPAGNSKNTAIGSYLNGFINFQFYWVKNIQNFNFGLGIDFSHYSNSAFKTPNLGLNTVSGFFTIGYEMERRHLFDKKTMRKPSLYERNSNRWHINVFGGIKQNLPDYKVSRNFGIFAVQGLYKLPISFKWDVEFGLDLIYNEANRWFYTLVAEPISDGFQFGAYTGLAANIYQTQIYFGLGVYAFNPVNPAGWIYNRIGARYLFNENWNLTVGIKAHAGVADYLEMGIGYRFD
jgi:hypothetical protein